MQLQADTESRAARRLALVTGTSKYTDTTLQQLRSPGSDAEQLAAVLEDPERGNFQVTRLIDVPKDNIMRGILTLCRSAGPRDLVLIYLSCHGVLDERNRLYYAAINTERDALSVTAVPAGWLNDQLEECRAAQQLMILDCCHSGAFAEGRKGGEALGLQERFHGRGRIVLTASRSTEYSFEGAKVLGDTVSSVFTRALVDGILTGEADHNKDGFITVSELYAFVYDSVRSVGAHQTPSMWSYGTEGDVMVAHSPRSAIVEPAPLADDLRIALESARPQVREGAVRALADMLGSADASVALSALTTLQRVADEDIHQVAAAARSVLGDRYVEPGKGGRLSPGPTQAAADQLSGRREQPASVSAGSEQSSGSPVLRVGLPESGDNGTERTATTSNDDHDQRDERRTLDRPATRFVLYLVVIAVGAVIGTFLSWPAVHGIRSRTLNVTLSLAIFIPPVAALWIIAMLAVGQAKADTKRCLAIVIGATAVAAACGPAIAPAHPFRVLVMLESVVVGIALGLSVGGALRLPRALGVVTVSCVLAGLIATLIVPISWATSTEGKLVGYDVVTTVLQVLVAAIYLARLSAHRSAVGTSARATHARMAGAKRVGR